MPIAACRPYHWYDIGGIDLKERADKRKKLQDESPERALIFEKLVERQRQKEGIVLAIASFLFDD
jgi:hypothetical protein